MPIYRQPAKIKKPIKVRKLLRKQKRLHRDINVWYLYWKAPGQRRICSKSCATDDEELAEGMRQHLEAELVLNQHTDKTHASWGEFMKRYIDEYLQYCAEATYMGRKWMLTSFLKTNQTKGPVEVTRNHLVAWMDLMRSEGKQMSYIAKNFGLMKATLKWAESHGIIGQVPPFPKLKNVRSHMRGRPLTEDEFRLMLTKIPEVINQHDSGPEVIYGWERELWGLWWSGLRVGEVRRLRWDADARFRIDFSREFPVFHIAADAQKNRKDQITPIAPEFAKWLQGIPENQRHGKVFKQLGKYVHKYLGRLIAALGKAANIITQVQQGGDILYASAHDFRRSFGERWAYRGIKEHVLMVMMRHEKLETTMQFYVGKNVQMAAESMWEAMKDLPGYEQIGNVLAEQTRPPIVSQATIVTDSERPDGPDVLEQRRAV